MARLMKPSIRDDGKTLRDLVLEAEGYKDDAETAEGTASAAAATATTQATTATTQANTAAAQAAAAAASAAAATAVVVSGDVSLNPAAGQVPLARSNGRIDPHWIKGGGEPDNWIDTSAAASGAFSPVTTELVFTPQMFREFEVFIPAVLTTEIVVYRSGTNGIFITTEKKIRINAVGIYESEPLAISDDWVTVALSRNDNETSTVTVVFMHNGNQLGSTIVQNGSDAYIANLFAATEGFYTLASIGHGMSTSTATARLNAAGEAVGLSYDLSVNTRNGSQATAAARPLIGRVPSVGQRNQFTDTENLATWVGSGAVAEYGFEAPNGTMTAWKITFGANVNAQIAKNLLTSIVGALTRHVWIRSDIATTIRNRFTNNGGSVANPVIDVSTVWTQDIYQMTGTGTGTSNLGLQNNAAGNSEPIYIWRPQAEPGSTVTAYQRVGPTIRDVTEPGVPDVWYHFFDRVDDILNFTVPAITNGTIVLAGRNGIWIDSLTVGAGTLSLGATTYTGGPAGMLAIVGDVIGCLVIDKALSEGEKTAVINVFKAKGAPGYFEVTGAEIITNGTFTGTGNVTGWALGSSTNNNGVDVLDVTSPVGSNIIAVQGKALTIGTRYMMTLERITGSPAASSFSAAAAGLPTAYSTTVGLERRAFIATASSADFIINSGTGNSRVICDNISVRAITLNTGA